MPWLDKEWNRNDTRSFHPREVLDHIECLDINAIAAKWEVFRS
jgi:hypothetical protein